MTPTCHCGQPSPDAFICTSCADRIEQAVVTIAAYLPELDVTATRQDRLDGAGPALAAADPRRMWTPTPTDPEGTTTLVSTTWAFNWDASDLLYSARNTLSTWIRHLCESRGVHPDLVPELYGPTHAWCMHESCDQIRQAGSTDARITAWLLRNIGTIRQDEAAAQILDELEHLVLAVEKAIDRVDPDIYAGRCDGIGLHWDEGEDKIIVQGCKVDLYAKFGSAKLTCTSCGTPYDLKERKAHMLDQLDDVLARPTVIANGLASLDVEITASRIDVWASRKLIIAQGKDQKGKPLYRVGDVRLLLANQEARRARRRVA